MGVLLLFCISCELEFTLWISPHSGSPLETREEKKEAICLSSPKLRRGMRRRGREIPEKQQHSLWKSLEIIVAIDGTWTHHLDSRFPARPSCTAGAPRSCQKKKWPFWTKPTKSASGGKSSPEKRSPSPLKPRGNWGTGRAGGMLQRSLSVKKTVPS